VIFSIVNHSFSGNNIAMKTLFLAIAAVGLLTTLGCVEQKMTITSEPSGALVRVSDVEVGRTPVTIPFTATGDYAIKLSMEGYQTLKTHANIKPTAYEIPPLDLFAELLPHTFCDQRYVHFKLEKLVMPSDEDLISRAKQMRQENLQPPK
jgi:hypothetical protein